MPGGALQIELGLDYHITMTGPVTSVAHGTVMHEALA